MTSALDWPWYGSRPHPGDSRTAREADPAPPVRPDRGRCGLAWAGTPGRRGASAAEARGSAPTASDAFRGSTERSGRLWRGGLDLAIDRRGRLVGQIQARTSPKQTLPPGVFEIGVVLYRQADRGKGYGREAVDLLTTWLFEPGLAERVQAGTAPDNAPMRAVLERLGFRLEGTMRGFAPMSDGTRIDGAMYAVIRSDWQKRLR